MIKTSLQKQDKQRILKWVEMHRVEKWETNVHVFTKILFFLDQINNVKFNAFFPSNNLSLLSKLCEFIVNENSNFLVTNSYIHTSYILCTRWLYMFIFLYA